MRVLVTGGAGFIGSNFIRMIATDKLVGISSVKVLDKLTYAGLKGSLDSAASLPSYEFIQGDICDSLVVSELLKEVDAVINFAAESHVDRSISGASDFVQTNIVGVQVLLDAIKDSGKKIRFLQRRNHDSEGAFG
jgi:dTDP-glucose 4,6-dehydratase